MNSELRRSVRKAYEAGVSKEDLAQYLREAGWGEKDVELVTKEFVAKVLPASGKVLVISVPQPSHGKDAFFAVVTFFAMLGLAFHLGLFSFAVIDLYVRPHPDPWDPQWASESLWSSLGWLVLLVPLWIGLTWWWNDAAKTDMARMFSPVRRWLTYITLALTAFAVIIDLGLLLSRAFVHNGQWVDLLDSFVVLAIASFFFLFYYAVLRRTDTGR